MVAVAKNSIPVFNSNSRVFNSNSIFNSTNFNSNSYSGIWIEIELQFQFDNWIDPIPDTCPHNSPHIPSCYNNEQTTKQTKAINNSYIYISHVNVTQTVPDILPMMPMHQDPLLVIIVLSLVLYHTIKEMTELNWIECRPGILASHLFYFFSYFVLFKLNATTN